MNTIAPMAPAAYSQVGAALAREAMNSYNSANRWTDADTFIGNGLRSIMNNADTTSEEKAIATLGSTMGNHAGMQYQNSAQARYAAAQAIASMTGGSIGHVLAVVGMNAYAPANKWQDADAIAGDALLSIANNANSNAVQQSLARASWDQTNVGGLQYQNSAEARREALGQIAQQP